MRTLICLLLTCLLLTTGVSASLPLSQSYEGSQPMQEAVYTSLRDAPQQNWLNLTYGEMAEDFDFLYNTLRENYPFFGVARRVTGNDLHAAYPDFKLALQDCKSDMDFLILVMQYLDLADGAGHLSLQWWENSPGGNANFAKTLDAAYPAISAAQAQYSPTISSQQQENVSVAILEEGKIAYAKINTFHPTFMDADKEILFDFYRQVSQYDHLVIDITGNGGGGMDYYWDLLVGPNIDETLYSVNYLFLKDGNLNYQNFMSTGFEYRRTAIPMDGDFGDAAVWLDSVKNRYPEHIMALLRSLPYPPAIAAEDREALDYYQPAVMSVSPSFPDKLFQGSIWVLVDGVVYSASESFANFCKNTGFATLVGTQTGGDGIGSTPVSFYLPNSGLQIRYAPIYGTTIDGRNSEEFGTTPDILSPAGESPLETCLDAIRSFS